MCGGGTSTESSSRRLTVKEEQKEGEQSASDNGSSADEHLMPQELQESDKHAMNIKPKLPSGISDSLKNTVKTEDDDWDTKWRVEVPNRDPLELAPDTKVEWPSSQWLPEACVPSSEDCNPSDWTVPEQEDTVQFLEHEETVQFTKQENTDQATELEDTVQFLEQKNADQFMEHEETVQCSEQGDTVEITKQEDTIQFSEQEDADHITKQEDTVQFSEQDTAQVRPMSPPIDFIGFMEADWVSARHVASRRADILLEHLSDEEGTARARSKGQVPQRGRPQRRRLVINYREVDGLDDSNMFCDVCCRDWEGECPVHGALKVIHDAKAPPGAGDPERDVKTLPRSFSIGQSKISESSTGVFADRDLPARQRLGPYEGTLSTDRRQARTSGYRWKIKKGEHVHHLVNAEDPSCSNWLRRVNCARSEEEANLVPFQHRGLIYFRTSKPVPRGSELLVYYGDDSARELTVHSETSGEAVTPSPAGTSSSGIGGLFQCLHCDYGCMGQERLKMHVKKRHRNIDRNNRFQCERCQYSTDHCGCMKDHRGTHTGERPYGCDICEKSYSQLSHLTRHRRVHTGERPYRCDICSKSFAQPAVLTSHRRTHTGERPYPCELCNKSFFRSSGLVNHRRTHTGERPYRCNECNKTFTERGSLTKHRRTHTGERPYRCDICGKSFAKRGVLTRHSRTHTGEGPYRCDLCDKAFADQNSLARHRRTHTGERPYRCDICDKAFAVKCSLTIHRRTHTGERPYRCDICDKTFSVQCNLANHRRLHTGERPYRCDVCNKSFPKRGNLTSHCRIHT